MQRPLVPAVSAVLAVLALTACGGPEEHRDTERPSAPGGVTAQASSATSVHVMWRPATDDRAVTGYEVFQQGSRVKTVTGGRVMTDVDGLTPRTAYRFSVRARDAAGNLSVTSTAVPVTTPVDRPDDRTAPSRPTRPHGAVVSGHEVVLGWAPSSDDTAVTAYDIYQEDSRVHSVGGGETTARITRLRPGTVYTFTVRARDAAENSSPDSEAVDLTTPTAPGARPVTAPAALTATAVRGAVRLTWTPPVTGAPVREHQLYLDGKFATTIVWGGPPPTGTASYTFTVTDPPGTRYSVKLRARLPDGTWGGFSAQRTVVTR
ncbi:fibronectin type III domain-containing protein [Streptomyces sp. LP05-1]|uniref:Fibronectin type III domain-containing protein n=1 Tax=Streptomyces pyxinae TaxID=2970734 RepID=A0ABT2CD76_9ACTN|nr:fibronectin type III domain-containing protein [Streptomyces sp. LP05-1]MCS0635368.1 fibronectin type III domain-containing protein [Streptomyces sp. LP05-1]